MKRANILLGNVRNTILRTKANRMFAHIYHSTNVRLLATFLSAEVIVHDAFGLYTKTIKHVDNSL